MSEKTHQQVLFAIDSILQRGGQVLYETYLNEKMPNDCKEDIVFNVTTGLNAMVYEKPIKATIQKDQMPKSTSIDVNTPHKIKIRPKSETKLNTKGHNICYNTFAPCITERSKRKDEEKESKPNFCIKFNDPVLEDSKIDQKLRRQIIKSEKSRAKEDQQNRMKEEKILTRRQALQNKINQALRIGTPYSYDDQGNFFTTDPRRHRQQLEKSNKRKPKPFSLRFKAIEMLSHGSEIKANQMMIQGKNKGYSSRKMSHSNKKLKISEDQFNNNNSRQFTNIPYMQLENGTKIIELQQNVMAQRSQLKVKSRQQHLRQSKINRDSLYRTLNPSQSKYIRSFSMGRPGTQNTTERKSYHQQLDEASRRPRTSFEHRVKISNKQLANEMIQY